jgi:hypothetical protein
MLRLPPLPFSPSPRTTPATLLLMATMAACHRDGNAPPPPSAPASADAATTEAYVPSADPSLISQSPESGGEIQPSLAMTADGRLAVAWMSAPGDPSPGVGIRFSTDEGATWKKAHAIQSPGGRTATDPVVASDPTGNIYLAWLATGPDGPGGIADSHLYIARADAPGVTLGPPADLSDEMHRGARLSRPSLATMPDGTIVVTWSFSSSVADGIAVARSADGHSWTKGIVIQRIGLQARFPFACSAAHGDRVWVAYLDAEAGVRVRASDDEGSSWSPSRGSTVSTADERPRVASDGPVCTGDADDVTVAYGLVRDPAAARSSGTTGLDAIVIARSVDGGRTFDSRRTLAAGGAPMMHPALAREPDGTLDLAFYVGGVAPESGALRWLRAANDQSPFGASKVVRPNLRLQLAADQRAWPGAYFGWGFRAGSLYAASVDNSGEAPHVAFSRIAAR